VKKLFPVGQVAAEKVAVEPVQILRVKYQSMLFKKNKVYLYQSERKFKQKMLAALNDCGNG